MRNEDLSQSDSQASPVSAHDDYDVIPAGSNASASGNAITGRGTVSGAAGADEAPADAHVTAISGTNGSSTGGNLAATGRYGDIRIEANGDYVYHRHAGGPDNVEDVFNYTLTDRSGVSDNARLAIRIEGERTEVQANAQRVNSAAGVIALPEGVELSDIHVVGRDLVITLPDGTQMVIADGAVFVPQLALGSVEIPASNLAALLIDSEPRPAAGIPQSGGGNFIVPVGPLDPGVPLGDLLPPTALDYTPPGFEETYIPQRENDVDYPVLVSDLTPKVNGGDIAVDEDDLPAGSDPAPKDSLVQTGSFTISAPDGVQSLVVGTANLFVNGNFQAGASITTPLGNTLTFTSYNAATGAIGYSYTLGGAETHGAGGGENNLFEDFTVTLTDTDGDVDTDTLTVRIVDDVTTANDDGYEILEGDADGAITLNVKSNDVSGADGTGLPAFTTLVGTYGSIVVNGDGQQTYTLSAAGQLAIDALAPNATLTDTFNYQLTDGDGDTDPAVVTITLRGTDDPVTITNLTPKAQGGDTLVDEDDLLASRGAGESAGSDPVKESTTGLGTFNISAPDGVRDLVIDGHAVIDEGVFTAASWTTALGNTLSITAYNAATGQVSYSYALLDNEASGPVQGENAIYEDFTVTLTDFDTSTTSATLSVQIVDDVTTANDDGYEILEGDADGAITLNVKSNDVSGADGTGLPAFTTLVGTYGSIVVNGDGQQTYTLSAAGQLAIDALAPNATLTDTFNYQLTDGDGDTDPAVVTITLRGTDDPVTITNLTPKAQGGDTLVDEDDLLASRGAGESAGSDPVKESTTGLGTFNISAPDGVRDLVIDGHVVIDEGVFTAASWTTALGNTLSITAYNAATGQVSYSYALLDNEASGPVQGENAIYEDFTVTLTDFDTSTTSATLSVQIVDDVTTANDDGYEILEGDADGAITLNVKSNDVSGADGTGLPAFTTLVGTYGSIVVNGDGQQTYTLSAAGQLAIDALAPNATLTDTFNYQLTDGDGDTDPAVVTITLRGTDDPVTITNLTPKAQGGDTLVDEDDLLASRGAGESAGSDPVKESTTGLGTFNISAPDGVRDLVIDGHAVIDEGVFTAASWTTALGNTLSITAYNAATGQVSYSYALLDNEASGPVQGENAIYEDFTVTLTDFDTSTTSATLSVQIVDDVTTANDDGYEILEGDADGAITLNVKSNDVSGADGTGLPAFTTLVGTYGSIVVNGDGQQTYTLSAAGQLAIDALAPNATLTDTFNYQLTDGDGDTDPAVVTITLRGTDDPVTITNLTPKAQGGDTLVDEDDLLASRGAGESAGSDPVKESTTGLGTFNISAPDGVRDLVIDGHVVIDEGVFTAASWTTALGNTLSITAYNAATGQVSYSYALLDNEASGPVQGENAIYEDFTVTLTDFDTSTTSATLSVQIVDDVTTANDDGYEILEGDADGAITLNVKSNDVSGADGTGLPAFTTLVGTYGSIVVNGDGQQTYTLSAAGQLAIDALAPNATLTDTFNYQLTDGDGDTDPAVVTITLRGTDDPVTITNLTPKAQGGDTLVDEDDLLASRGAGESAGSDPVKESTTGLGTFNISAPDGVRDLVIDGHAVIDEGVFTAASWTTALGNTLSITAYNAATGQVSYSYALLDNEASGPVQGENAIYEDFTVTLTDFDTSTTSATLSVQIVDDVTTANDDGYEILEGDADGAITLNVKSNDVSGADGTGLPAFTTLVGTYGSIVVNGDGQQTYTLSAAGQLAIDALAPNATLTDTFNYQLTDGDGDTDPAVVTITLRGTDDPVTITNLTPKAQGGDTLVDEDDLLASRGAGESAGSDPVKESTTGLGTFNISAPDGVRDLVIDGHVVIDEGVFTAASWTTALGNTLSITAYNAATGQVSYSYALLDNEASGPVQGENAIYEDFTVTLTDFDTSTTSATLSVQIVDDVTTANDDGYEILEGDADGAITLNVKSNDVSGADGTGLPAFTTLVGTYGSIVVNGDGQQTYTLSAAGQLAIDALAPNATLTDTFNYQLTDGDGDTDPAVVTITLRGTDDPVTITNLTPKAQGGDTLVDEDDLLASRGAGESAGSDPVKESTTGLGTFNISAPDGVRDLVIDGHVVIDEGVFTAASWTTALGNTLSITAYNAATGQVSYSYALLDNEASGPVQGENAIYEDFTVTLTDFDTSTTSATLSVQIVDDVTTANDDGYEILEGDADGAITLNVKSNDVSGADGTGLPAFTTLVGTYGSIVVNGDGQQTYTLSAAGQLAIDALAPNATLTDTFNYQLTDGDGDTDPAVVTITLRGTDDPVTITNLTPKAQGGDTLVDEDDLLASRGAGESAGSDPVKESTTGLGTFNISAPDGVRDLVIDGHVVIDEGVFTAASWTTALGNTLSITAYNAATGQVSYSYALLDNEASGPVQGENAIYEDFTVTLTDFDTSTTSATLSVQIVDDVTTANDDGYEILEGDADGAITLNVKSNDVSGADGTGLPAFTTLVGTYGSIVVNGDGQQTYTLSAAGQLAIDALAPNATLTDTFNYQLTDGDGDTDPAVVTITLRGTDDPVTITNLTPKAQGGDTLVDEDDLLASRGAGESAGSDPVKESTTGLGTFNISAPDGVRDLVIDGHVVIDEGVFTAASWTTALGNTLSITAYNAATGQVSYSYALLDNEASGPVQGENAIYEDFTVTLTDFDTSTTSATLSVQIVDDVTTANDDGYEILEGDADGAITLNVKSNDVSGADGTGLPAFTTLVGTYGSIVVNGDGQQTYTLSAAGQLAIDALAPNATLTDTFNYQLTDGDGDTDPAVVTITLRGTDDPVTITNLTPKAQGGDTLVDEDDLLASRGAGESAGSDPVKESTTGLGTFNISAPDGVRDLVIDGHVVIDEGVFTAASWTTALGNTLSITAYNAATGQVSYSYALLDNEASGPVQGENAIYEDFTVTLTDFDTSTTSATLSVQIVDDVVTAIDDTLQTVAEDGANIGGNVRTNDVQGADGAVITHINLGAGYVLITTGTDLGSGVYQFTKAGVGVYTIKADGTWTFDPALNQSNSATPIDAGFSYRITDGDSDISEARQPINVTDGTGPSVAASDVTVDEQGLPLGSGEQADFSDPARATNNSDNSEIGFGTITVTPGSDGVQMVQVKDSGGIWVNVTGGTVGTPVLVNGLNGQLAVWADGSGSYIYRYTLTSNLANHPDTVTTDTDGIEGAADPLPGDSFAVRVTDSDGTQTSSTPAATSVINITVLDDAPAIYAGPDTLTIANSGTVSNSANFDFAIGADQRSSYSASNSDFVLPVLTGTVGVDSNNLPLSISGANVAWSSESATQAVFTFSFNYMSNGVSTAASGTLTFDKANGSYTVDLLAPIQANTFPSIANASAPLGYHDGTNTPMGSNPDVSVVRLNNGMYVQFSGYAESGSGTGANNLKTSTDNVLDVTDNEIFTDGEILVQGRDYVTISGLGGNGVHGDTMNKGEVIDFDIFDSSANPTGFTNLAPTGQVQSLFVMLDGIGNNEDLIMVVKLYDTISGTYTTKAVYVGNEDFFKQGDTDAGKYQGVVNSLDSNDALIVIEQDDYNSAAQPTRYVIVGAQITISDEGLQGAAIALNGNVDLYDANNVLIQDGDTLDSAVTTLAADSDDTGFKIKDIGFVTTTTVSQSASLNFATQLIDSEGDKSSPVNLVVTVTPVVLDTDHDGDVAYLGRDAGVRYDYNGDGITEATAWAAAGDSILVRDANHDGTVTDASEFVFGHDGLTDLQALAGRYGDTLDADDADFGEFKVWNDANANGAVDSGELRSLSDAGITSISLVSDNVVSIAAGGDVMVAGNGAFTYVDADGNQASGTLGDAAFVYGDAESELEQRFAGAANSSGVMAAAIAAMGLAAGQAAHADSHAANGLAAAGSADGSSRNDAASPPVLASGNDARPSLGNEQHVVVDDAPAAGGHQSLPGNEAVVGLGEHDAAVPASEAPADAADSQGLIQLPLVEDVAPIIVIPEGIDLPAVESAHHNAVVGQVLVEALEQDDGPSVDALLANIANDNPGAPSPLEIVASPDGAAVPGWDMGHSGYLPAESMMTIVSEAALLHQDAVQPALNG